MLGIFLHNDYLSSQVFLILVSFLGIQAYPTYKRSHPLTQDDTKMMFTGILLHSPDIRVLLLTCLLASFPNN